MTQDEALEILKMGRSAFITGSAGSGKTHLLNTYIRYLRDNGAHAVVGITASTGIAATHMGGMTIHAYSGLGIRDTLSKHDLNDLTSRSYLRKRIERTAVLIIDEISMLHHFRLDLVERIIRAFKKNNEFFGGLQIILAGDFFQLPPVSRENEADARFAYHCESWKNLGLSVCYLEEQHRQNDEEYLGILNAIRGNEVSEKMIEHLKTRSNSKIAGAVRPTKLYSHNVSVDAENERELGKIEGEVFEYQMSHSGIDPLVSVLKKSCLAPERLRLKVAARVMFVKNNFEEGYVNCTIGVVSYCDQERIEVKIVSGRKIEVSPTNWRIEDGGRDLAEIVQYPLRLAWAITVHKSQGMSLDAAEIDLSGSFEKGMGYVALSRLRTLSGLSLLGLNDMALQVSPEVLEYDKIFREESKKAKDQLGAIGKEEIAEMQKDFLDKVKGLVDKSRKKKPDTTLETKKLAMKKVSLREMASARKLTAETIISHLEKIKKKEPAFDVNYLKEDIPTPRFNKILAELRKTTSPDGTHPLAPAKFALGDDFSYQEIRLARLFL